MSRVVDGGAVVAAYVGIGMAVTIAISFLLVIPIGATGLFVGVIGAAFVGYYANQRSDRRAGPWHRILVNGAFAGAATGLALGLLLLAVSALFFSADDGYRDASAGGPLRCEQGADCVYQRYLAEGRGDQLAGAGVSDAESFGRFYWTQQLATATLLASLATATGVGGAVLYGLFGRRQTGTGEAVSSTGTARRV